MPKDKYNTAETLRALTSEESEQGRLWSLVRLIAWAFLDQKDGKKRRRARNARQAGRIVRAKYAAQDVATSNVSDPKMLESFGGISTLIDTPTPKVMLRRFQKAERSTHLAFRIMQYLLWSQQNSQLPPSDRTVDFAKKYIAACDLAAGIDHNGEKKLSKIWERYARSAPVIFAAYAEFPGLRSIGDIGKLESYLRSIARRKSRIDRFLNTIAVAAHILKQTKVRKVHPSFFSLAGDHQPRLATLFEPSEKIMQKIRGNRPQ